MNLRIQNLDDWPYCTTRAGWREILNCSDLTFRRAELKGDLIPSGVNHKLYTKRAILQWLGIPQE
jgi:hypothetical protein